MKFYILLSLFLISCKSNLSDNSNVHYDVFIKKHYQRGLDSNTFGVNFNINLNLSFDKMGIIKILNDTAPDGGVYLRSNFKMVSLKDTILLYVNSDDVYSEPTKESNLMLFTPTKFLNKGQDTAEVSNTFLRKYSLIYDASILKQERILLLKKYGNKLKIYHRLFFPKITIE